MKRKMNPQVATVYELMLKRIISYELLPEAPISDTQIAKELGMSRAPVREAILSLVMDGLVKNSPDGKMIVAPIKLDDIIDILHVRFALESEVIRIISKNGWLSKDQLMKLEDLHKKFDVAAEMTSVSEHYMYDDKFHSTLVSYSNSKRIIDILENMRLQMQRARWLNMAVPTRQKKAIEEHTALLNAIKNQDLDSSLNYLCLHVKNSAEAFQNALANDQMRQIAKTINSFFSQS